MMDAAAMFVAARAAQSQMAMHSTKVASLGHAMMVEAAGATGLVEAALLSTVLPRVTNLGYFRLLSYGEGADPKLDFMRGTEKFGLGGDPYDSMYGITVN